MSLSLLRKYRLASYFMGWLCQNRNPFVLSNGLLYWCNDSAHRVSHQSAQNKEMAHYVMQYMYT